MPCTKAYREKNIVPQNFVLWAHELHSVKNWCQNIYILLVNGPIAKIYEVLGAIILTDFCSTQH